MDGKIDFAINLVSLEKTSQSSARAIIARLNILNNIQSREENKLSLFIFGHCRDVGLENFYDMFTILLWTISLHLYSAENTTNLCSAPCQELAYNPTSVFSMYHLCEQVFATACQ